LEKVPGAEKEYLEPKKKYLEPETKSTWNEGKSTWNEGKSTWRGGAQKGNEMKKVFKASVFLQKVAGRKEAQIKFRISSGAERWNINVGFKIEPRKWDSATGRVKKNCSNSEAANSLAINRRIQFFFDAAEKLFQRYEVDGAEPNIKEVADDFRKAVGRKKADESQRMTVNKAYVAFMGDVSVKHQWEEATLKKYQSLRRILSDFGGEAEIKDFGGETMGRYIQFLFDRGYVNSTVKRNVSFLRTFLRWCEAKGFVSGDWRGYECEVKVIETQPVFLTFDELLLLFNFEFPADKGYLSRCRDCFCFASYTGMRYSDVAKLNKADVTGDSVKVVIKKTDKVVNVLLNRYSRAILDRYRGARLPGGKALPCVSDQKENVYIKEVAFFSGLSRQITSTYRKGGEKVTEQKPLFSAITFHSARRTFVSNMLAMGVPAATIMAFTGHSSLKTMLPYIGTTDEAKADAMAKIDGYGDGGEKPSGDMEAVAYFLSLIDFLLMLCEVVKCQSYFRER
jgi:site-specific recombinase XerD